MRFCRNRKKVRRVRAQWALERGAHEGGGRVDRSQPRQGLAGHGGFSFVPNVTGATRKLGGGVTCRKCSARVWKRELGSLDKWTGVCLSVGWRKVNRFRPIGGMKLSGLADGLEMLPNMWISVTAATAPTPAQPRRA